MEESGRAAVPRIHVQEDRSTEQLTIDPANTTGYSNKNSKKLTKIGLQELDDFSDLETEITGTTKEKAVSSL